LYRLEALDVQDMEFANNSACVELLEGKGVSVMAVLADEVRTKNGSDQGFLDKLYLAQSKSLHFEKPRMKDGTFTIKHYAQSVSYTATGFVEKNRNKVHVHTLISPCSHCRAAFRCAI
jgi:myosin-5